MRPIAMIAGLALAIGAAPVAADAASCPKRTTGTVVGAVAGGLLGSAIAGNGDNTEGVIAGAALGGLAGNQLTKCKRRYATRSYRAPSYRSSSYRPASYARAPVCRYETRAYYDPYGQLVHAPQRVCR
jgi:outer membrane lipoprotein SlyB